MKISRITVLVLAMSAYAALFIRHDRWIWSEAARADATSHMVVSFIQAGASNDVKTLTHLLRSGVNVNSQDNLGLTALIAATSFRKHEAATFLLDHGSDPSLRTNEGLSALDFAKANHDETMTSVLEAASR